MCLLRATDRQGHTPLGHILIDKGARLDVVTSFGDTPLHDAAGYGQADFCQMLLRRGANPHVMANKGKTPLQYARARGYPACVTLIEEAEAQLAAQDAARSAREAVERLGAERVTNERDRKAGKANAKAKAERERAMADHQADQMQVEKLAIAFQEAAPNSAADTADRGTATAEPVESEVVPPSEATASEPDVAREPAVDNMATPRRSSSGASSPSIGAPSTGSLPASPRSTGVPSDMGPARSPRPAHEVDEPVESASPEASPESSPMASSKAITPTASPRRPASPTDVQ